MIGSECATLLEVDKIDLARFFQKNKNFVFLHKSVEMPHEVGQSLPHKVLFVSRLRKSIQIVRN